VASPRSRRRGAGSGVWRSGPGRAGRHSPGFGWGRVVSARGAPVPRTGVWCRWGREPRPRHGVSSQPASARESGSLGSSSCFRLARRRRVARSRRVPRRAGRRAGCCGALGRAANLGPEVYKSSSLVVGFFFFFLILFVFCVWVRKLVKWEATFWVRNS